MIKLALTDLDETLIHFGLSRATDHALAAIEEAQAAGVHVAAVTGRIMDGLLDAFDGRESCCRTAALSNGQIVLVDGELAHAEYLDHDALALVADLLREEPGYVLNVVLGAEAPRSHRVIVCDDPSVEAKIHTTDGVTVECRPDLPDAPIIKANVHVLKNVERMAEVRARMEALSEKITFVSPGDSVPLLDIAPAAWGKDVGADILCEALGLSRDEVAVFGDAENDLDIMRAFPNSVAVANATEEVAAAARWHIGASADDAVADALLDIARAAREAEATGADVMPAFMSESANERGLAARERPLGERRVERLPLFTRR
ncbi:HAD family hydrolase [Olsenella intestinalis]|uniref:HAD family hydrolase n=1 Tax=Olsenella intestinalis TaxID=2930083 RepID=UPI00200F1295|nr:HAD family hydrolase [Olsenella intestinalis]